MERLIEKSKGKSRPLIWLHDYINGSDTLENISYLKRRVISLEGRANSDRVVPIFWKGKHIGAKSITPFNKLFIEGSDYYKVEFGGIKPRMGSRPGEGRVVYRKIGSVIGKGFSDSYYW